MLKKYLEQQQANLKQMGQRQQQLNQQAAYAELQQQQQVCQKQVAYSKGIEAVIQHRELAAQQKQQKAEQQQADEIAMQLFQFRLKKPA